MNVMPVLRRLNLAIFVRVDELNRIGRFLRFNDQRRVMVHFTLMTCYHRSHRKLTDLLPRGGIHHPREVVGVTYVVNRERMDVSKDPFVRDVFFMSNHWTFCQFSSLDVKHLGICGTLFHGLFRTFFEHQCGTSV